MIGPILIVLDWLLARGRIQLGWKTIWWIVGFPLAGALYTMVRGPLAYNELARRPTWYPYPFLDPSGRGGYFSVAIYVVLIAVIIGLVGVGAIWVSRRSSRRSVRDRQR